MASTCSDRPVRVRGFRHEGLSPSVHEALPCASCSGGAFLSDGVDGDGSGEVIPAGIVLGAPCS